MNAYAGHSNLLLHRGRCGVCAEPVSGVDIMRGDPCPSCGKPLVFHAIDDNEDILSSLKKKWRVKKWVILGVIAFASLFAGQIPLLQSALMIAGVVLMHFMLIRKPLQWLPKGRRVFAKLNVKLLGSIIAVFNLFINVLIWPFMGVNGLVLAVLSVVNTLLFVQVSMFIIERRLMWEKNRVPFGIRDWIVPALVGGTMALLSVALLLFAGLISFLAYELYLWFMSVDILEVLTGG